MALFVSPVSNGKSCPPVGVEQKTPELKFFPRTLPPPRSSDMFPLSLGIAKLDASSRPFPRVIFTSPLLVLAFILTVFGVPMLWQLMGILCQTRSQL